MPENRIPAAHVGSADRNRVPMPKNVRTGRPAPERKADRPPMTYGQWRNANPDPARKAKSGTPVNRDADRRFASYNSAGTPRQMHIPIPPSAGGKYPAYPERDPRRTSGPAYSDRKAAELRMKLRPAESRAPAQPQVPKKQTAQKTPPRKAPQRSRTPVPENRRKAEVRKAPPQKRDWAMPENSVVYTAYGTELERSVRPAEKTKDKKQQRQQLAQRRAEEKKEKRRKRRFYVRAFFIRLGIVFLLCAMVIGGLYFATFHSGSGKSGSVDYYVKAAQNHSFTAGSGNAYRDGVLYIDFSQFAKALGIASVGSVDSVRFIIPDADADDSSGTGREEYVIFSDGMRSAAVNGTTVMMEGACRTVDVDVWVPFSFVENYVNGLVYEKDKDSVTVRSENEDKDENGNILPPELTFSLKKSSALAHVEYPEAKKDERET